MSTQTSVQQHPPVMANGDVAAAASAGSSIGHNHNHSNNYPLHDVPNPHPHDVLCGRGGATNSHIGNSHWRTLVTANKELYVTLPKREKQLLSKSIVHAVRSQNPPGRFLQKDFGTGLWFDVGEVRALEKTSQALREGAPQLRDKLKVTDNSSSNGTEGETTSRTATSTVVVVPSAVPPPPPPVPAVQGPVADQRKIMDPHKHAAIISAPPSLFVNGKYEKEASDDDDDDVPPPPSMMDPTGEFSFGTITIPDPSEVGGLENGFSFGSVMSGVVEPSSSRYCASSSSTTPCIDDTVQIIGGPSQQQHQHQQHSSRPVQRDSLADAAGRLMPPTGLQSNELSFGSIMMTDAEQSRLESNMQQQRQEQQQQQQQQPQPQPQQQYNNSFAQPLYASTQRDNHVQFGRPTAPGAAGDDVMGVVQPVDGGLEPAGLSAGSMMSIGTINTTNLENAGMSLGSMYSAVDGGLEAIGTSFGSMTIGGPNNNNNTSNNNPPLPAVVPEAPPLPPPPMETMEAVPTFLRQKRSTGNLLECSDTESEDEEHSAQASAQKSANWEKLKATFEAQMAGGAYNSATVPPSFNSPIASRTAARKHQTTATANITAAAAEQQPLVLNIPESGFGRDLSQMSAFSVENYQDDLDPAENNLIPFTAAAAPLQIGGQQQQQPGNDDSGAMPPPSYSLPPPLHVPPPQGGGLTRTESDELRALEVTLLNRGSSLASEDFEVPL